MLPHLNERKIVEFGKSAFASSNTQKRIRTGVRTPELTLVALRGPESHDRS